MGLPLPPGVTRLGRVTGGWTRTVAVAEVSDALANTCWDRRSTRLVPHRSPSGRFKILGLYDIQRPASGGVVRRRAGVARRRNIGCRSGSRGSASRHRWAWRGCRRGTRTRGPSRPTHHELRQRPHTKPRQHHAEPPRPNRWSPHSTDQQQPQKPAALNRTRTRMHGTRPAQQYGVRHKPRVITATQRRPGSEHRPTRTASSSTGPEPPTRHGPATRHMLFHHTVRNPAPRRRPPSRQQHPERWTHHPHPPPKPVLRSKQNSSPADATQLWRNYGDHISLHPTSTQQPTSCEKMTPRTRPPQTTGNGVRNGGAT